MKNAAKLVWLAVAVIMLASQQVLADDLLISTTSYHYDRSQHLNETNPGVIYESNSGLVAGTYYNSYRKQTVLLGWAWRPLQYAGLSAGVAAAAVTGYRLPYMAAVSLRYSFRGYVANVMAVPAKQGVIGLSIGRTF